MAGKFFNVKWEKREVYEARLNALAPNVDAALAEVELAEGRRLAEAIRGRAPRKTGAYQRSIQAYRLVDLPAKVRERNSFINTKDPNAVGIVANYIWRWLEFGTVKQSAQPHIFPTYRAMRKSIRANVRKALRKAVKQAMKT